MDDVITSQRLTINLKVTVVVRPVPVHSCGAGVQLICQSNIFGWAYNAFPAESKHSKRPNRAPKI